MIPRDRFNNGRIEHRHRGLHVPVMWHKYSLLGYPLCLENDISVYLINPFVFNCIYVAELILFIYLHVLCIHVLDMSAAIEPQDISFLGESVHIYFDNYPVISPPQYFGGI